MAGARYDFVIIGATPAAALLAGLLASVHGKRVLRIASQAARQRLSRHLDLALPIATRPGTWAMIQRGVADMRALLVSMGALDAIATTDVELRLDTAAGLQFGAHLGHMAAGFGLGARLGGKRWTLSRVPTLHADLLMPKLATWLAAAEVDVVERDAARLSFGDAGTELSLPGGQIEDAMIILADDDALHEIPEQQRPASLRSLPVTVTLTARTRPLAAGVALFPERRVALVQQPQQQVLAIVAGEDAIDNRIASGLHGPFPIGRLATSRYRTIQSLDAAPLVGRLQPSGAYVVAGLGDAAAFAMPALARQLAGAAESAETAWFAAHDVGAQRAAVAEFAP